jgi:hypothetical protein
MRRVMVRYKVKPGRASENEGYIARVFEQLADERPEGVRYAVFKLDDGVSFVHIAASEAEKGRNPLTELSAFKAFTADIRDRCAEPPSTTDLREMVGSYRFLGD